MQISRNKGRLIFSFKTLHAKTTTKKDCMKSQERILYTGVPPGEHLAKTLLQESDVRIIFCCHITSGKTEKRQKSATITRICGNGVACDNNAKT